MNRQEIEELLSDVVFRDWEFLVREDEGLVNPRLYLQVQFLAPDNWGDRDNVIRQRGRKWFLSEHMTVTEIVNTAFLAVRVAVEHELREEFLYKTVDIYNGHIDVETLVDVARNADVRT